MCEFNTVQKVTAHAACSYSGTVTLQSVNFYNSVYPAAVCTTDRTEAHINVQKEVYIMVVIQHLYTHAACIYIYNCMMKDLVL